MNTARDGRGEGPGAFFPSSVDMGPGFRRDDSEGEQSSADTKKGAPA